MVWDLGGAGLQQPHGVLLPRIKIKYLFKVFELARQMANEISISIITYDNARYEDAYRNI